MKKLYLLPVLIFLFASCEVIIVEPVYDYRNDIIGNWELEEYSETYNITTIFPISISKSLNDFDAIRIHNFYDVNITVRAYLDGNRIIIPLQVRNGYEIEGVGNIRASKITFSYSVYDQLNGGITDYCDSVAW